MKRLNGWQRIGIVLSVGWIIGATCLAFNHECKPYLHNPFDDITPPPDFDLSCYTNKELADMAGIKLKSGTDPNGLGYYPAKAALLNSLPVPVTWLVVYSLIWIFRWIKAGFVRQ